MTRPGRQSARAKLTSALGSKVKDFEKALRAHHALQRGESVPCDELSAWTGKIHEPLQAVRSKTATYTNVESEIDSALLGLFRHAVDLQSGQRDPYSKRQTLGEVHKRWDCLLHYWEGTKELEQFSAPPDCDFSELRLNSTAANTSLSLADLNGHSAIDVQTAAPLLRQSFEDLRTNLRKVPDRRQIEYTYECMRRLLSRVAAKPDFS